MPSCNNCGAMVTDRYARVLGDNNNEVQGCPECRAKTDPKAVDEEEVDKLRL